MEVPRTLGTSQLTYYFQGYDQVWGLYQAERRRLGEAFELKAFLDGMMAIGPVPVAEVARHLRSGAD